MIEIRKQNGPEFTAHEYELWCGETFLAYAHTFEAATWAKREIERLI